MRDSVRSLWAQTFQGILRVAVFAAVVIAAIVLLPPDTPRKIGRFWQQIKQRFADRNQPFLDFLTNKDMERALPQYEQFKKNPPAKE